MDTFPDIPTEWVGASNNALLPIALNGQFGQDSDDPIDKDHAIYSMEEVSDSINNDISQSRAFSVMMEADILAQDGRWSPDGYPDASGEQDGGSDEAREGIHRTNPCA
eukprot:8037382-Pyramimonas_sp.AAC.1